LQKYIVKSAHQYVLVSLQNSEAFSMCSPLYHEVTVARVEVRQHEAGHEDQLGHHIEVPVGDVCPEVEEWRIGSTRIRTIAKPEKMAPSTKNGGEQRLVPAGDERHREVPRHHTVHESTRGVAKAASNP